MVFILFFNSINTFHFQTSEEEYYEKIHKCLSRTAWLKHQFFYRSGSRSISYFGKRIAIWSKKLNGKTYNNIDNIDIDSDNVVFSMNKYTSKCQLTPTSVSI